MTSMLRSRVPSSGDGAQKLFLQDELALLVLFTGFIRLIVFPADGLLALAAVDVAYYVTSRSHIALVGVRLGDVDDGIEEVRLAVLTAEVLMTVSDMATCGSSICAHPAEYVVVVGEMRLAVLAAVDARRGRVEVDVVREAHIDGQAIRRVNRGLLLRGSCVETVAVIRAVVRGGHSLLVAAGHTCCWRGCKGRKVAGS